MTLTIKHATLTALCALLFSGCFTVQDPLATTDAGMEPGTGGTAGVDGTIAGSGYAWAGSGFGEAGTTDMGYAGIGFVGGGGGTVGLEFGVSTYGGCRVDFSHSAGTAACIGYGYLGVSGGACSMFTNSGGSYACAPLGWACEDAAGKVFCYDPSGGAGMGGSAGNAACDCDDGNACTADECDANGKCLHESLNTMTDYDEDGTSDGCDCDDGNADVHPGVTAFSTSPYVVSRPGSYPSMTPYEKGAFAFDFDCDGIDMPRYTAMASDCERWAPDQPFCLGEGWVTDPKQPGPPACGAGGAYQVCAYDAQKDECLPTTLMLEQSCR